MLVFRHFSALLDPQGIEKELAVFACTNAQWNSAIYSENSVAARTVAHGPRQIADETIPVVGRRRSSPSCHRARPLWSRSPCASPTDTCVISPCALESSRPPMSALLSDTTYAVTHLSMANPSQIPERGSNEGVYGFRTASDCFRLSLSDNDVEPPAHNPRRPLRPY